MSFYDASPTYTGINKAGVGIREEEYYHSFNELMHGGAGNDFSQTDELDYNN
jgi:hypothetical protein